MLKWNEFSLNTEPVMPSAFVNDLKMINNCKKIKITIYIIESGEFATVLKSSYD